MNKEAECQAIRTKIDSLTNVQSNYTITMYAVTAIILVFAIERNNGILFLLPYIILFSFQRAISVKQDTILKLEAYMAVYIEEGDGWENRYERIIECITMKNMDFIEFKKYKNMLLREVPSQQLGLVCSGGCILTCIISRLDIVDNGLLITDPIWGFILIVLSVVLYYALHKWCGGELNPMEKRAAYIESLKIEKENENKIITK